MTTKFKAGDKVVRTEAYTWEDDGGFMQVGKEYTVVEASEKVLVLKGDFNNVRYDPDMFKLVKPACKNMKFRVSSPEHSKEIQEALFEMGYVWKSGKTHVQFENDTGFFVTNENGKFSMYDEKYKINGVVPDYQEYTVETTKSYKLIPVVPKPETIEIDGKTYDKEAVLKRLAELEVVH